MEQTAPSAATPQGLPPPGTQPTPLVSGLALDPVLHWPRAAHQHQPRRKPGAWVPVVDASRRRGPQVWPPAPGPSWRLITSQQAPGPRRGRVSSAQRRRPLPRHCAGRRRERACAAVCAGAWPPLWAAAALGPRGGRFPRAPHAAGSAWGFGAPAPRARPARAAAFDLGGRERHPASRCGRDAPLGGRGRRAASRVPVGACVGRACSEPAPAPQRAVSSLPGGVGVVRAPPCSAREARAGALFVNVPHSAAVFRFSSFNYVFQIQKVPFLVRRRCPGKLPPSR